MMPPFARRGVSSNVRLGVESAVERFTGEVKKKSLRQQVAEQTA